MEIKILFDFTLTIVGLMLIIIILISNKQVTARFLALPIIPLTCLSFFLFMFDDRLMLQYPHLFRVAPLLNFLIAPAIYLYIKHQTEGKNKLKTVDIIHLIPFLLYLIDYLPFYTKSANFKYEILKGIYADVPSALHFSEGWLFPAGIHDIARHIISLIYVIFTIDLLNGYARVRQKMNMASSQLLTWMVVLVSCFFILSFLGILNYFILPSGAIWLATSWQPIIISFILYTFLLFNPEVMYGSYLISITHPNDKKKHLILPEDVANMVRINLKSFIKERQFLNKNIRVKEVADQIGVQPYILSAYIYQIYEMHFNDFINLNRVHYTKDLIKRKEFNMYTLEAISEQAGFSNRTTFLTAFKKFTGMTPTFYVNYFKNEGQD